MKPKETANPVSQPTTTAFWSLFWRGSWDAAAGPVWMLGASMMGFGALIHAKGYGWFDGLFSTLTAFALPGQVILLEQYSNNASLLVIWLAVAASSVRLMPMVVVFLTAVRPPKTALWKQLFVAHVIAITAWVYVLQKRDTYTREQLWPYANGFAWTMYVGVVPMTGFGYFLGDLFHPIVSLCFLMFLPLYFATLFSAEWKHRGRFIAILIGATIGPPLYWLDPDWGLLASGLIAGTTAFLVDTKLKKS